ncbi:chymotrypsin family serine protease [Clavibacter michiganensis]|uniref:trypsin-like peptidase domain-containing protein n=1 Tax=Clavibacter michiganensis TaxID=28447 RepID=UPI001DCB7124|nr:trypsin-like peptidase domain-containing protein [Clavibacter michiganensis]MDO4045644.1 serine protease [Clavibacter michiganensis]MDO4054842.1 serine protease [Clavibacter michiganensis]MDO4057779.1 serine protease [Clavibacter michiganensis]MWJ13015.1 serine protease [Clavibacter michiganensis subsp. michiganensis]MWJ47764.1 serine protease [Clavibacter michiganensis subsp. michiganensis]
MSAPAGRRTSPSRCVVAVLALLVCAVLVPAAPARTDFANRNFVPIVAGSALQFPGAICTAGLVVVRTGLLANISPRQRATRYVVTAKHCGDLGAEVKVAGVPVGAVTWVDPREDLELVRIDPLMDGRPFCAPSSAGFHCTGTTTFQPRASGRVLLETVRFRTLRALPVTGTGAPAAGEVYCVSAVVSGQSCVWSTAPWKPEYGSRTPGEMAAKGDARVAEGDSGGPVVSAQGRIYGNLEGDFDLDGERAMIYVRISHFFEDAGAYALAPA